MRNENKNFRKKCIYSFEGINEIWLKNLTSVGKISMKVTRWYNCMFHFIKFIDVMNSQSENTLYPWISRYDFVSPKNFAIGM